jgi:hypothetical protein
MAGVARFGGLPNASGGKNDGLDGPETGCHGRGC